MVVVVLVFSFSRSRSRSGGGKTKKSSDPASRGEKGDNHRLAAPRSRTLSSFLSGSTALRATPYACRARTASESEGEARARRTGKGSAKA